MAAAELTAQHAAVLDDLLAVATRDLTGLWSLALTDDAATVVEVLLETTPVITDTYGTAAAGISADYYDEARTAARAPGAYRAAAASPAPHGQVQATTRWSVSNLFAADPNTIAARTNFLAGMTRLILQASRDTIATSTAFDPVRTGFVRTPRATACGFCLMLASRGAVYLTRESATRVVGRTGGPRGRRPIGARFHDHCRCTADPIWDGEPLPTINQTLHELWQQNKQGTAQEQQQALVAAYAARA